MWVTCGSPRLSDVIELLRLKGADVHYHDPYVSAIEHNGHSLSSEANLADAVSSADCLVIVTDHSSYDWAAIRTKARLIVDTRHALA